MSSLKEEVGNYVLDKSSYYNPRLYFNGHIIREVSFNTLSPNLNPIPLHLFKFIDDVVVELHTDVGPIYFTLDGDSVRSIFVGTSPLINVQYKRGSRNMGKFIPFKDGKISFYSKAPLNISNDSIFIENIKHALLDRNDFLHFNLPVNYLDKCIIQIGSNKITLSNILNKQDIHADVIFYAFDNYYYLWSVFMKDNKPTSVYYARWEKDNFERLSLAPDVLLNDGMQWKYYDAYNFAKHFYWNNNTQKFHTTLNDLLDQRMHNVSNILGEMFPMGLFGEWNENDDLFILDIYDEEVSAFRYILWDSIYIPEFQSHTLQGQQSNIRIDGRLIEVFPIDIFNYKNSGMFAVNIVDVDSNIPLITDSISAPIALFTIVLPTGKLVTNKMIHVNSVLKSLEKVSEQKHNIDIA
ncbi:MAG: hypothetical protein QXP36_00255 [Conexivisphaerales archaeon]